MLIKYKLEQIKKNETGGPCSMDGGQDSCIQDLVGKPERKRPPGRPRHRWEDNIKMDIQSAIGGGEMYWFDVAQNRDR